MERRVKTASSTLCPACHQPVDSLRAGHVAILDGAFRYFCDAACKAAYVEATSKRPALDAMTAEPPPVASAERSREVITTARSGVRDVEIAAAPSAPASSERELLDSSSAPDDAPTELPAVEAVEEPHFPAVGDVESLPEVDGPGDGDAPFTLRSPSVTDLETELPPQASRDLDEAAPPPDEPRVVLGDGIRGHLLASAPIVGVLSGVLASVVSLAGESAGVVRLPLAVGAAAIALMRLVVASRDSEDDRARRPEEPALAGRRPLRAEPSPWVVAAPIALGGILAALSTIVGHPHADAHASFVGLAAAAALATDLLLMRSGRDVSEARARVHSALTVDARVIRAETEEVVVVPTSEVKPGEQVRVSAPATIPVDGVVSSGEAEVAPWLDSPVVARKGEGDTVVAGAMITRGEIVITTTFAGGERSWLRMLSPGATRIDVAAPLVAAARGFVERGAPIAALLVGAAVFANNASWLDVGVAACGGGFALAAFAAVSAAALTHARGHAAAQRRGIIYKDADSFDTAARADVAVMCSRGTILLGEPEIVAAFAVTKDGVSGDGWLRTPPSAPSLTSQLDDAGTEGSLWISTPPRADLARVLAIAAGAEMSSTHPFASAILREARGRGIKPESMRSAAHHSGLGVTALAANGDRVIVGSRAFLLQEKVSIAIADARTTHLEAEGRSVLLVAVSGKLIGLLALQDGLRKGVRAAVQRLHDARIEPVLLSGESRETTETIARALDIEHIRPEILPADRGAEVRALADGGRVVAAMGHATTDDGALGAAELSIAMESAGAAPGEWGAALASDDVRDAALALTIPRASRERSRVAIMVGGVAQAASALGIAFGVFPPAIVPVLAVLAVATTMTLVRDTAST